MFLLSSFVGLLQSLGDTRVNSELQTLICETDDGQELWLFSFCFPALFDFCKALGGLIQSSKP
jgi:hypothetical protein